MKRIKEGLESRVELFHTDLPDDLSQEQVRSVTDFQAACRIKLIPIVHVMGSVLKQGEDKGFGEHVSTRTLYGTFAAVMTLVMFLSKTMNQYLSAVRGQGYTHIVRFCTEIMDQEDDWLLLELCEVSPESWQEVIDLVWLFNEHDELEIFEMYATISGQYTGEIDVGNAVDYSWLIN